MGKLQKYLQIGICIALAVTSIAGPLPSIADISPRDINDLEHDTVRQAMNDVSRTISEVQRLLHSDPKMPRLTRGEIEELFENVTREELAKSIRTGDRVRERHMRALMLVLPYNTDNNMSSGDLQELYTRPPVTRMVAGVIKMRPTRPATMTTATDATSATGAQVPTIRVHANPRKKVPATTFHPRMPPQFGVDSQAFAEYPSFRIRTVPTTQATSTTTSTTTTTTTTPRTTVATSPMTSTTPSTTAPSTTTEEVTPNSFTEYEQLATPQAQVTVLDVAEPIQKERFSSSYNAEAVEFRPVKEPSQTRDNVKDLLSSIGLRPLHETTTSRAAASTFAVPPPAPAQSVEMSDEIRQLLLSFGLLPTDGLVTPPSISNKRYKLEDRPHISATIKGPADTSVHYEFKPLPQFVRADDFRVAMTPQLTRSDYIAFKPLPAQSGKQLTGDLDEFLRSFGIVDDGQTVVSGRASKSIAIQTSRVLEKIDRTPEVSVDLVPKQWAPVLGNLGIRMVDEPIKTTRKFIPTTTSTTTTTTSTTASPRDEEDLAQLGHLLATIKKLEAMNVSLSHTDLEALDLRNFNLSESLLSQSGLFESPTSPSPPPLLFDDNGPDPVVSAELDPAKNEVKRQDKSSNVEFTAVSPASSESEEPTRFTFDLISNTATSPSGIGRAFAADVAVNATASATATTTTEVPSAVFTVTPTPDDTDVTTVTSMPSTTIATTTTELSRNIGEVAAALGDSFSGGIDPVTEEPLPPPRRNGFYFLADWNSFLEVGDGDEQVVVRFDPKVGDPSRFIPVKIP